MQRKRYYFNDGLGGIVVARNLNQAIKILSNNVYTSKKDSAALRKEIKKSYKSDPYGENINTEWAIDWEYTNDKAKFDGWIE